MSIQKRASRAWALCGATLLGLWAGAAALQAQGAPAAAPPMNPLSVEPRVPRLGIAPCVVELFRDVNTGYYGEPMFEPEFQYAPPADCPGPWAKAIFVVELQGPGTTGIGNVTFGLGDPHRDDGAFGHWSTELLVAGAQYNPGQQRWRVERDITEYSALLRTPRPGFARDTDGYFRDPYWGDNPVASGWMIFYPATAGQPAPEVPDAVFPLPASGQSQGPLPRNIERVYLDVHPQIPPGFWFSCVPADAAARWPLLVRTPLALGDRVPQAGDDDSQGCVGSGYRELVVRIDGQAAGVAPLFPWLNSDLNLRFERSVDVPVPTPQSINLMPYRVDLTPFAALLSDGAEHLVEIGYMGPEGSFGPFFHSGQLLVYLDEGSTQVTGAVTRNTLHGTALESTTGRNDWTTGANATLTGDVERLYRRQYEIAGYVVTSRGRIDTTLRQEQLFSNTQHVTLARHDDDRDHAYAQKLDLTSITERTTLRQRGARVLAFDRIRHHFPLRIDYSASGGWDPVSGAHLDRARAWVSQGHHQQRAHYRPAGTYADRVYANFVGSRAFDAATNASTRWQGVRSHYFHDSAGSCSRERVTWLRASVTSHTQGVGCPDGVNRVRGFAHPDGSPDDLGWLR